MNPVRDVIKIAVIWNSSTCATKGNASINELLRIPYELTLIVPETNGLGVSVLDRVADTIAKHSNSVLSHGQMSNRTKVGDRKSPTTITTTPIDINRRKEAVRKEKSLVRSPVDCSQRPPASLMEKKIAGVDTSSQTLGHPVRLLGGFYIAKSYTSLARTAEKTIRQPCYL